MKKFQVAGVSKLNGVVRARFAQDMSRARVLEKNDHTDIMLFKLPVPMSKVEAAEWLLQNFGNASEDQMLAIRSARGDTPVSKTVAQAPAQPQETVTQPADMPTVTRDEIARKKVMFPSHTEQQLIEVIAYQKSLNQD